MLGVTLTAMTMRIEGTWSIRGSIYRQTRETRMEQVNTWVSVESDGDPELVAAVLRNAPGGCYAEQALKHPVPINETLTVNGAPFDLEAYPIKPVRRARGAPAGKD